MIRPWRSLLHECLLSIAYSPIGVTMSEQKMDINSCMDTLIFANVTVCDLCQ